MVTLQLSFFNIHISKSLHIFGFCAKCFVEHVIFHALQECACPTLCSVQQHDRVAYIRSTSGSGAPRRSHPAPLRCARWRARGPVRTSPSGPCPLSLQPLGVASAEFTPPTQIWKRVSPRRWRRARRPWPSHFQHNLYYLRGLSEVLIHVHTSWERC